MGAGQRGHWFKCRHERGIRTVKERFTLWPDHTLFDEAVAFAAERRLSDTLRMLKRIGSWQHRQSRHGSQNHDWHDAELLWLQGVVLERSRHAAKAADVWRRLAPLFKQIARRESSFLPQCARCAERVLEFAPSWYGVATQLRHVAGDVSATAAAFREHALSKDGDRPVDAPDGARPGKFALPDQTGTQSTNSPDSHASKLKLKAKRELIRKTYRDMHQPSTVVELSEEYLKLDSLDGVVWAWYGHRLADLGRYSDAAVALQTARGLVATQGSRAFVRTCQGDLEFDQGRYAQAEECYREAADCDGAGDWPMIMLGRTLARLGCVGDAEQCFRKAVSLNGSHPATALYELGRILRAQSEFFESRRILKQALALESHDDVREALADVERVIRLQSRAGGKPTALPS
jgi:tetratricopeptide (TPR) repeat protein